MSAPPSSLPGVRSPGQVIQCEGVSFEKLSISRPPLVLLTKLTYERTSAPNERQFVRHWDAFRWSPPRELGTALACLIMQFSQPPSGMSCLHCPKCRGGRSYAENNNGSIIQFEICAFCEFQFVLNGNEQKLGSSELTELYDHNNITITVLCSIVMQLNLAIVCDFMKCAGQLVKAP